jgi:hypothetical protein
VEDQGQIDQKSHCKNCRDERKDGQLRAVSKEIKTKGYAQGIKEKQVGGRI